LTFESASFSGGRLTSSGALLYVTDYLGSVRAVVNGSNGAIYKASDYSTFGSESEAGAMQTAPIPFGLTLRDGYTGKEAQTPDFTTGYTDFGARQYSPTLRRWMTPDPLSEKYYGVSPYAFCNNNPVNLVDPDGRKIRVASEYQKQFSDDLKAIFGDKVESFSFEDEELTLNVSKKDFKKGLSRDQKALFRGLYKALSDDLETTVVYENNYSREVNGEVQNIDVIKDYGGALCTKDELLIVVAPNIGTVTVHPFDGSPSVEVIQNTASGLFHEKGERNESHETLR
jgi:RHS repeat-associated protein